MKNKIKNSKILVTGGAGFVGSHLVEKLLLSKPDKIYIIDNLFRGKLENISQFKDNSRVEFYRDDIQNTNLVDKLMKKADYCFHMAALRINACAANPRDGFEVMVKATFNLVESAKKYKLKKLIYSSSASIYGLAQKFPTPESNNPYDNQTFYGAAKLFGEQLLRSYHYMYGLDYIALRYFNIYGPKMDRDGKYTEVLIKWLECIKNNTNPIIKGNGSTTMDFIFVDDVVNANILALQSDKTDEVFNVGSGKETSLKELLIKALKVNNSKLLPVFTDENVVNPVKRRLADIKKAKKILGFKPKISLEKGLKKLSQWYFE